ncbi:MAG: hypothetical protein ILA17_05995 [Ruminococcus sp.]|nr:hypothetical protein [Ruminiclostridium sp.]MBP1537400.1 hypothetical protein [Ruminococcus sp.]
MSKGLTDEQVRAEIKLLSECPEVKLARAELRQKYRERQRLYTLRNLAKRGAELRAQGKNIEDFRAKEREDEDELLLAATEGAVQ